MRSKQPRPPAYTPRTRVGARGLPTTLSDSSEALAREILRKQAVLEARLATSPFLVGETRTLADLAWLSGSICCRLGVAVERRSFPPLPLGRSARLARIQRGLRTGVDTH